MDPHPAPFWYDLGVNPNDVRIELVRSREETIERLQNSSLMSPIAMKTITRLTGHRKLESLAATNLELFVEIWCLWRFYNNRRRVYLIREYVDALGNSVRKRFFKKSGSRGDRFNCLLVVSVSKDELLKRFLLMDSVDIRSFQKLQLKGGQDRLSSLAPINGARIEAIASSLIEDFETERKEQKESRVERVLSETQGTFLFVRRQIKESIITQARDSIVVKPAERIVVQFLKGGKEVHVSARTKKTALDFVNMFAKEAWGTKARYEKILFTNTEKRIKSFLSSISTKTSKLPIVRITISQSPLEGYPDLDLSHQDTVVPSIKQLKDMGVDVMNELENIEGIVVRFEQSDVELHPRKNRDGTYEMVYSDNRLPWAMREAFEKQMKKEWDLDVTPKA